MVHGLMKESPKKKNRMLPLWLSVSAMDLSYFENMLSICFVMEIFSYHIDNGGLIIKKSREEGSDVAAAASLSLQETQARGFVTPCKQASPSNIARRNNEIIRWDDANLQICAN